jgi:hypothetical protein
MKPLHIHAFLLCAALAVTAQSASAKELVAEFTGPAEGPTREFEVEAPWILDWLVSGSTAEFNAVDISLYNVETGRFEGTVLRTKNAGNGVQMFDSGGRFYFQVNASMMDWNLKVYQLTRDEAKEYKPKSETSTEQ